MKKTVCIVLSVLLMLAVATPASAAAKTAKDYPTIMVAGYSASNLFLDGEQVWGLATDDILNLVLENIARVGRGLGELALQRPQYLSSVVGQGMVDLAGKLAFNPDGTSVLPLTTYYQDAAHTQLKYLNDVMKGENVHEKEIMADLASCYGEDGNDHMFCYQHDFRMSMVDCAAALDKYVDSVLEYTGAEKVNIFAVSHGGQTVAAYLALYGLKKNVVNNAVLTVPAIGGAALAYDVMSENVVFDEETLLYFIENGQMMEEDIDWLVRANQFGILDDVCNLLMHNYVKQIIGYWGSIWDFIPTRYYEELKNEMLDPVESAELIEKSDYFHYEVLAHMNETLNACVAKGMNIYLVAGCGNPSVTGLQEQSDAIITVQDATGAKTAPYGLRFNDGYLQARTVCKDNSHNHLSPDMTIDASAGYLPDQTWFVDGMFHGMTWKDDYAVNLCKTLLFADSRVNVDTYTAYPQFKYATNRNYSALAALNVSKEGYWTAADNALVVTNLSHKYKMRLISVTVDGADVYFDVKLPVYLEPGASCTIPMRGTLPETSLTTADITVNYSLLGCLTPLGSRTQVFTVMNGPAPAYNADEPYTAAHNDTAFDSATPAYMGQVLKKLGLYDWLKMLINSMITIMKTFQLN